MPEATALALPPLEETTLLDRGKVGVICLIFTEIALFSIFLTAYVFYIGKSLNGPYPKRRFDSADLGHRLPFVEQPDCGNGDPLTA
jgi:hypothetical protein